MSRPIARPRAIGALAAGVAVLAVGLAAPAADAAYAPKLKLQLSPATPDTAAAITSTVTQASGETASRKVVVTFPPGFQTPSADLAVKNCSAAQISAKACPADSRLGDVDATTPLGGFKGGVFLGGVEDGGIKIVAFVSNGIFLLDQTVVGKITVEGDHFVTTFDGLPDVLTTKFTLGFKGGTKYALSRTPIDCGDYRFDASFTSQKGERATSSSTVTVGGCPAPGPTISGIRFPRRFAAGTRADLRFRVDKPVTLTVRLTRAGSSKSLLRRTFTAKRGRVTVNNLQRIAKQPGSYALRISAKDDGGRTATAAKRFRVTR